MKLVKKITSVVLISSLSQAALAHVGLERPKAVAGSYHKLTFKIGHGCEGSSTHTIKISLPETTMGAKPMPKAGWKVDTSVVPLNKPYTSHGKTVEKDVREVTWSGGLLPDAFYDEFSIQVKLTDNPGKIYFKVTQLCEKGRLDWIEIPAEGQSAKGLKAPAPVLEVEAAVNQAHH